MVTYCESLHMFFSYIYLTVIFTEDCRFYNIPCFYQDYGSHTTECDREDWSAEVREKHVNCHCLGAACPAQQKRCSYTIGMYWCFMQ